MKSAQLQELVRLIARQVLKEYTSMSSTSSTSSTPSSSSEANSMEDLSDVERDRMERELDRKRAADIKTAKLDIDNTKKQTDYFKTQVSQNKLRLNAQNKNLQNLQANKKISSGGAGSISAN